MEGRTIAAISTGMTNSGIGKVRMSGPEALEIIKKIYRDKDSKPKIDLTKSHVIKYGYIYDGDKLIDEVLVLIMKAPHTYTREDIIEIDCHGGVTVVKKVLETVLKYGAVVAEPGEFTKRAFLNGRIDLTQAEAVIDIINSKNEYALNSSLNQLKGKIHQQIVEMRKTIIGDIAFIEASMDDPEHIEDQQFTEKLKENVKAILAQLEKLLKSSDNGRLLKEGIKTVIVGKPNAGKSSLLNTMLGEDRAIVTEIAGTTRDTLEEFINLNGVPLNIIDTAGIRETEDIVEQIGVLKAKDYASEADLIIYVVDGSKDLDENDFEILDIIDQKKAIILINKIDLGINANLKKLKDKVTHPIIEISIKEDKGIENLIKYIEDMFFEGNILYNDEVYITNMRHKEAIKAAIDSLLLVNRSVEEGLPEDFFSIDLMNAYEKLGEIIGESVDEDLVNTIFSDFCMGK